MSKRLPLRSRAGRRPRPRPCREYPTCTSAAWLACSAVYYWPKDHRGRDEGGKLGILHVKCAVADGRWLFLSSANLTEYAFTINMELGVLVTGSSLPGQAQEHFDRLIAAGILARV